MLELTDSDIENISELIERSIMPLSVLDNSYPSSSTETEPCSAVGEDCFDQDNQFFWGANEQENSHFTSHQLVTEDYFELIQQGLKMDVEKRNMQESQTIDPSSSQKENKSPKKRVVQQEPSSSKKTRMYDEFIEESEEKIVASSRNRAVASGGEKRLIYGGKPARRTRKCPEDDFQVHFTFK
ncbi:hypothetical protein AKO1_003122 [Acrasis kona]|uniref:Uncharacterized protein n=1 Tax=Acrasis kona TaxID=1008807 RepID=A0AAW2Z6T3_9EUKA